MTFCTFSKQLEKIKLLSPPAAEQFLQFFKKKIAIWMIFLDQLEKAKLIR